MEPVIGLDYDNYYAKPVVRDVLEEQFPQYRGRILFYCPGGAVAQGAARFAARE
jgi:hypothetical protein